jgi:hypothetical protein
VGEREDLEAARVGDDRPLPAHEPVEPSEPGDPLGPRRQHQVEGVAQHELVAQLGDLRGRQRANAAARRQRDEGRRLDRAVDHVEPPGSGGSVSRGYLEAQAFRVVAHDPEA